MLARLILPELGHAKIAALTPAKIRQWHAGLGAEHPTRNAHAYALLHAICATAVHDEVLDANPCRIRAAMQTKRKRDVDVLSPAEVDRLASKMPAGLRASVVLAAWCGLRWGETAELRRMDVAPDCSVLRVRRAVTYRNGRFYPGEPKTAAGVPDVAVPPHIRPIIKVHLKNHVARGADSLLFGDEDGSYLHADRYRSHWEKARAAIGKPNLRVHDLRHVGAVLAAQSGATTAELMQPTRPHNTANGTAVSARRRRPRRRNRRAAVETREGTPGMTDPARLKITCNGTKKKQHKLIDVATLELIYPENRWAANRAPEKGIPLRSASLDHRRAPHVHGHTRLSRQSHTGDAAHVHRATTRRAHSGQPYPREGSGGEQYAFRPAVPKLPLRGPRRVRIPTTRSSAY